MECMCPAEHPDNHCYHLRHILHHQPYGRILPDTSISLLKELSIGSSAVFRDTLYGRGVTNRYKVQRLAEARATF